MEKKEQKEVNRKVYREVSVKKKENEKENFWKLDIPKSVCYDFYIFLNLKKKTR